MAINQGVLNLFRRKVAMHGDMVVGEGATFQLGEGVTQEMLAQRLLLLQPEDRADTLRCINGGDYALPASFKEIMHPTTEIYSRFLAKLIEEMDQAEADAPRFAVNGDARREILDSLNKQAAEVLAGPKERIARGMADVFTKAEERLNIEGLPPAGL
jgi:hypothetical protein